MELLIEIAALICLLIVTTLIVILIITMIVYKITDIQCNIKIIKAADRIVRKEEDDE